MFGSGSIEKVAEEIRALSCKRALVLSTHQQSALAEYLAARLGDLSAGTFTGRRHAHRWRSPKPHSQVVRQRQADCTVAIGGGSTTGLGKAMALRANLVQIVVPTTYAGSEATPILGETEAGVKTTRRTLKILPQVIVYDVDLTLSLPVPMSVTSGLNAIAHAVEGALFTRSQSRCCTLSKGWDRGARSRASCYCQRRDRSRCAIGRSLWCLAVRRMPR